MHFSTTMQSLLFCGSLVHSKYAGMGLGLKEAITTACMTS